MVMVVSYLGIVFKCWRTNLRIVRNNLFPCKQVLKRKRFSRGLESGVVAKPFPFISLIFIIHRIITEFDKIVAYFFPLQLYYGYFVHAKFHDKELPALFRDIAKL